MERTGGISTVSRGEDVTIEDEIGRGDRAGKSELLGDGVCLGSQSLACSMEKKRQEVHLEVVTFDDRVAGEDRQEDRVTEVVKKVELTYDVWWMVL